MFDPPIIEQYLVYHIATIQSVDLQYSTLSRIDLINLHVMVLISDFELCMFERNNGVCGTIRFKIWNVCIKHEIKQKRNRFIDCIVVACKYRFQGTQVGEIMWYRWKRADLINFKSYLLFLCDTTQHSCRMEVSLPFHIGITWNSAANSGVPWS